MNPPNRTPDVTPLLEPLEPRLLLSAGDPIFASVVHYDTGFGDGSVTSADFNGDGKPDLAVTSQRADVYGNNLSILLNNGDGTFASTVGYAAGAFPNSVAAADFNGDGKPDLAVANRNSNTVSVLLNNGNGTFASKVDYASGQWPLSIAAADFNGDGKPDLAVANKTSNTVSVLLNNGNGTFASKVDYAVSKAAYSITSADFNGDGKMDFAVANWGFSPGALHVVSVFLNNGNGTFASKIDCHTGSQPRSVTAADLNGDGKADLVTANASTVSVLLNNGNGTFASRVNYAVDSICLSAISADFNCDGKLDLAVANNRATVSVLQNNGDGTFAPKIDFAAGDYVGVYSVTAADFNGDGKVDLAVTCEGGVGLATVGVLLNQTTCVVDTTPPTADLASPGSGTSVAMTTLNNRGYIDVAFSDTGGSGLDALTIVDAAAEFSLGGAAAGGVTLSAAAPTLVPGTTSTYRYAFTGSFAAGPISVNFLADTWKDVAENPNAAEAESFTVTDNHGGSDITLDLEVYVQNELAQKLLNDPEFEYDTIEEAATALLAVAEANYNDGDFDAEYAVTQRGSISYFSGSPGVGPPSSGGVCTLYLYLSGSAKEDYGYWTVLSGKGPAVHLGLPVDGSGDVEVEFSDVADALTHELAHLQGALDLYMIEVDPAEANPNVAGGLIYDYPGGPWLMERDEASVGTSWDPHTIALLNYNMTYLSSASPESFGGRDLGYTWIHATDWAPSTVRLRAVNSSGQPVSDAAVNVYQKQYGDAEYGDDGNGDPIDAEVDFSGTTDANGYYVYHAASDLFGDLDYVILTAVEGATPFFKDITEWNLAYWDGQTNIYEIEVTAEATKVAEIDVLGNGVSIACGDTTPSLSDGTDFGSVVRGEPGPERTFTVRNDGGSTLTLGSVSVPSGFTRVEGLTGSLAPGASDTFRVRLDSGVVGAKSGYIIFSNNDSDENPFSFVVSGTVAAEPDHWDGGTGNWAAANWSGGQTPAADAPMIIDAAGSVVTVDADFITGGTGPAASLAVGANNTASLTVNGTFTLEVTGDVDIGGSGTMLVNGTLTTATGVTVAGGATLGGGGTINGAVTVESGGTLTPGASVGTLTINNDLTFENGGNNWVAELLGADADRVTVTGDLTLGDDTALEFVFGAADPFQAGTYTLASYDTLVGTFSSETSLGAYSTGVAYGANDITIELLAGLLPGDANMDRDTNALDYMVVATNYGVGSTWAQGDVNNDGVANALDYMVIATNYGASAPEPATLAILAMGGGMAVGGPEALPLAAAEPAAAIVGETAPAATAAADDFTAGALVASDVAAAPQSPAWSPAASETAAAPKVADSFGESATDIDLAAGSSLLDPLALPALNVRL